MNNMQEFNLCITNMLSNGYEVILGISKEDSNLSVIFYGSCSTWTFVRKSANNNEFEYGVIENNKARYVLKVIDTGDNYIIDTIDFINEIEGYSSQFFHQK